GISRGSGRLRLLEHGLSDEIVDLFACPSAEPKPAAVRILPHSTGRSSHDRVLQRWKALLNLPHPLSCISEARATIADAGHRILLERSVATTRRADRAVRTRAVVADDVDWRRRKIFHL